MRMLFSDAILLQSVLLISGFAALLPGRSMLLAVINSNVMPIFLPEIGLLIRISVLLSVPYSVFCVEALPTLFLDGACTHSCISYSNTPNPESPELGVHINADCFYSIPLGNEHTTAAFALDNFAGCAVDAAEHGGGERHVAAAALVVNQSGKRRLNPLLDFLIPCEQLG